MLVVRGNLSSFGFCHQIESAHTRTASISRSVLCGRTDASLANYLTLSSYGMYNYHGVCLTLFPESHCLCVSQPVCEQRAKWRELYLNIGKGDDKAVGCVVDQIFLVHFNLAGGAVHEGYCRVWRRSGVVRVNDHDRMVLEHSCVFHHSSKGPGCAIVWIVTIGSR